MSEVLSQATSKTDDARANLLFVDDERRVLNSMRAMFRRKYNIFLANSGAEALEVLENQPIDVVVSDQRMPGMTGVEVLKAFKDHAPDAMRILLTGYADRSAITDSINEGEVFRYLTKPCPRESLTEAIGLAVEAARGSRPPQTEIAKPPPPAPLQGPAEARARANETAPKQPAATPPTLAAAVETPATADIQCSDVELLVLSGDGTLIQALFQAVDQAHVIHAVETADEALAILDKHPIGVLVTDTAVNADEIQALTSDLKQLVPELVTIVASDHSDAHRMIDLINAGQVFRFLLKPIKPKQTSIWIESAVVKHVQLVKNPGLLARHVVETPPSSTLRQFGDQLLAGVAARITRFRERFAQSNEV